MRLNTDPNLASPDEFYAALLETHRDLSEEQSIVVNAKLILVLANHIGDLGALKQAMTIARSGVTPAGIEPARKETAS